MDKMVQSFDSLFVRLILAYWDSDSAEDRIVHR